MRKLPNNVNGSAFNMDETNTQEGEVPSPRHITNQQLLEELADDYAEYLKVDVNKQKQELEDSIEDMLMRLEEYCGLVDMVRSDTNLCLSRTLPAIYTKCQEMKQIFLRIDQLEAFVAVVKHDVERMEEELNRAEADMGSLSSIRKVFSNISMPSFLSKKPGGKKPSQQKSKFTPPEIFKTEDYLGDSTDVRPPEQ